MPVLPKNQLKLLFESGDLITETTLDDLINATYNPTLIAGAGIFLSEVSTPAGTDITISVTGATAGTVTSVSATNSAFINTTVINPTTTPSLQSVLSATGTPSASTFLRGDNTWATAGSGSVTSVGLSMPTAFTITNSPVTSAGTLTVTGAGTTLQYIDGTGALQTFPAVGGTYTNSTLTLVNFPSDVNPAIPVNSNFTAQTFTEMMNAMLYPTQDPALSPPYQTLSIAPGPQVNQYQEIGANIPVTLNATFNQGTISPAYAGGPSLRSGVPVTYNFSGPQVSVQTTSSLGPISENTGAYTILIGAQTWTNSVTYLAGGQPLDSNGNPFSTPLPGGTTSSISKTITGVYPLFATSSNIATLTIQSLRSMTTYAEVSLVTEQFSQPSDRQEVDIPDAWATITGVQTFDSVIGGGTWITTSLSDWTQSPTSHVIQTVTIPYTKYKNNVGFPRGAAQYRFLT